MGKGKGIDLDKLLGDSGDGDDSGFPNVIPPHIGLEGVDSKVVNAFFYYSGKPDIKTRLLQRMNPATEEALVGTLDWLITSARKEHYDILRADIWRQREAIKAAKKEIFPEGIAAAIKDVYVTYLIKQGLSAEKANSFCRMALAYVDATFLAWPSRHSIHEVKPKGFGPYAVLVYPIRRAVRFFMLRGANTDRYYHWTAGPTAGPTTGPTGS